MLTATLEKLVLSGNATYNTFVIGGTEKHILNVPSNRFIIITDLTYYSNLNTPVDHNIEEPNLYKPKDLQNMLLFGNTQLKIFSNKSNNHFVFRNQYNISPANGGFSLFWVTPSSQSKIDTYLVHESDVSFTFSKAGEMGDYLRSTTPVKSIAFDPPNDYGKGVGSVPVRLIGNDPINNFINTPAGTVEPFVTGKANSLQLQFPVSIDTIPNDVTTPSGMPLLLVGYVEIYGNPTNVSATL